jgi:type I restriction enzyme S subunit
MFNSTKYEVKKFTEISKEFNKKSNLNNQFPILSSSIAGIERQEDYFNKQVASENNKGYKIVPRGFFTYRSMSDTGNFKFNIQDIVEFGLVSPAYPVFEIINANPKYIYYLLNNSKDFLSKLNSTKQGGTRFALNYEKLSSIEVNLHSLEEQQKIGSFLSAIDELITKTKEKIRTLRIFKKKILDNLYVNKLSDKAIILESLVEFERGVSYKPFNLKEKSSFNTTTLLRSNNILNGKINLEDLQFIDNTIVKEKQFLRENDIIICMANGSKKLVGKNALVKNLERKKFTFGTFMGVIRPKQIKQSKYIYYLLNSNTFKKQIQLILAGTNINNLKGSDILKMNFSIELDEERIQTTGDVLFEIENLIDLYEKIKQNNEVIKNHYLRKIFGN